MSVEEGQARTCGSCKLCCKVFHVEELNKPGGVWCKHCPGKGCEIHNRPEQPAVCRNYKCLWLLGLLPDALGTNRLPEDARPDRLRVIFSVRRIGGILIVEAKESEPGAAKRKEVRQIINGFRKRGIGAEVICGDRYKEIFAPYMSKPKMKAYLEQILAAHGQENMISQVMVGNVDY